MRLLAVVVGRACGVYQANFDEFNRSLVAVGPYTDIHSHDHVPLCDRALQGGLVGCMRTMFLYCSRWWLVSGLHFEKTVPNHDSQKSIVSHILP